LRNEGAASLRSTDDGFVMSAARPPGYARPWARGAPVSLQPALRPDAPDATLRTSDLEPGDRARKIPAH
jgi:hypothetical protein